MSHERHSSTESAQLIAPYLRKSGSKPPQGSPSSGEQRDLPQALNGPRELKRKGESQDAALHRDKAHPEWAARIDDLVAWIDQNGGAPRRLRAADPTERSLAHWLAKYRSHARHGRHQERIRELDARVPGWRQPPTTKGSYTESAQLIAAYFRENGSFPALGSPRDGEQGRLAARLTRLRLLKREGKLPDAAARILDEAHTGWADGNKISSERLWQARAEELIAWVTRHGRTPYWSAIDGTERALASWVLTQRSHALHGRHPDRIKELTTRLPGWHRSPSASPKP